MTFGEENVERIPLACDESEATGDTVEIDAGGLDPVYSAEVNYAVAFDEYPEIVVRSKLEDLSRVVREGRMQLIGEREIVPVGFVLPALPVEWKEAVVGVLVERWLRIQFVKGYSDRHNNIHAADRPIPLIEVRTPGRRRRVIGRIVRVDRLEVVAQDLLDDPPIISDQLRLKVGMVKRKVISGAVERDL